jgi:glucuronoarabinoxylan endo-1,4-beta-xylanase
MVTGSYNAYVWWWIWDDPNDGVNYGLINSSTTSPAPTYYGYALGQFAKFIQPGYYRYSATANPSTNVYVSAYAGSESGTQHYVIVAINASTVATSQAFTIQNGTVSSLTPYQTTSSGGLVQQSAVTVSSGQFTYTLPAQSITTFVQ